MSQATDHDSGTLRFESGWQSLLPLLALWLGTSLAYVSSFAGTFVYDDNQCIVNNEGIRSVSNALDTETYPPPVGLYRRELVRWSLVLNFAISQYDTWSYHLVNLLIHLVAGTLLYLLVRDTIRWHVPRLRNHAVMIAFSSAWLWMLHPLQTESVTYIIQRLESLASLWYLAILYGVLRSCHSATPKRAQCLAIIAMLLGVFTKEIVVTAPLVAILYDRTFLASSYREILGKRKGLYAGLLSGVVIFIANLWYTRATLDGGAFAPGLEAAQRATPLEYLWSQPGVLLHYLKLSIVPQDLCLDYMWPIATDPIEIFGKGALILAMLFLGFFLLWKRPPIGFLIVSFFIILAPTSTIKPLLLAFEHRMYLPLACVTTGIACALTAFIEWCIRKRSLDDNATSLDSDSRRNQTTTRISLIILVAYGTVLGMATYQRNHVYRSAQAVWSDVIATRPTNARAWNNLGVAILKETGNAAAGRQATEKAIELSPKYGFAWRQLALVNYKTGRFQDAAVQYKTFRRLVPSSQTEIIPELSEAFLYASEFDGAVTEYQKIIDSSAPVQVKVICLQKQALAYAFSDDMDNAERCLKEAVEASQDNDQMLAAFGKACSAPHKSELARAMLGEASKRLKQNPMFPYMAAQLELALNELDQAEALLQEAVRRDSTFTPATQQLATLHSESGKESTGTTER